METVKEILASARSLPADPAMLVRLIGVLRAGDVSIAEVEKIIRMDEVLAMTVLKHATSAAYGRTGRDFDLKDSIVRLGFRRVLRIALELQAGRVLEGGGRAYGLRRGALRLGAVGGALAAEEIARRVRYSDADLAFVCALLRDVGKLVLDAHFGEAYIARVAAEAGGSRTFTECERRTLGADHAEVGAALAELWELPEIVVNAIRRHHDPPPCEPDHDILFDIVHGAELICLWAGFGIGIDGLMYRLAPHVRTNLHLDRHMIEELIALTSAGVIEFENGLKEPSENVA